MRLIFIAVPGIGHKVKSRNNPDLRVELVKEFVLKRFPSHKLLDYALAVESVTTSKKDNLILNVDGCVAVCFVDLIRNCGAFSAEEAEDYMRVINRLQYLIQSPADILVDGCSQRPLRSRSFHWSDCPLSRSKEVEDWFVQTSMGRYHLSSPQPPGQCARKRGQGGGHPLNLMACRKLCTKNMDIPRQKKWECQMSFFFVIVER